MSITSITFIIFVFLVLIVYYLLPRRGQNLWLLLASYIFLVSWDWRFAVILVFSTLINFLIAHMLSKAQRNFLLLGICFNLGLLVIFRSVNFFIPSFIQLLSSLNIQIVADGIRILLPIGLSYYALENISYLVDIVQGKMRPTRNVLDFALYLAYFPRLLAGPIERAQSFLGKLENQRIVDNQTLAKSFALIMIGATRKLIISDSLASAIPWDVFKHPSSFGGVELWGWLLVYAFVLYNDFAGYTNIVRGISGLFGIQLSPNFQQPYFARNFSEFWNRWHITLSHWLRDYIYIPLRKYFQPKDHARPNVSYFVIPPMATMLFSGLWHGFSAHMILWGALHGLYLILRRLPMFSESITQPDDHPRWRQTLAVLIVFILVIIAWVPFRMEVPIAIEYWRGMLNVSDFSIRYRRLLPAMSLIVPSVLIDYFQYKAKDEIVFLRWPRVVQASILAGVLLLILLVSQADYGDPFVYQGF